MQEQMKQKPAVPVGPGADGGDGGDPIEIPNIEEETAAADSAIRDSKAKEHQDAVDQFTDDLLDLLIGDSCGCWGR